MALSLLKYRLQAFSLVEVIVAMVILLTIFFIGIYFFASVNQHGFNVQEMAVQNTLEEYINTSKLANDFSIERKELNGWLVSRTCEPYEDVDSMVQVNFVIYKKASADQPFKQRTLLIRVPPQTVVNTTEPDR